MRVFHSLELLLNYYGYSGLSVNEDLDSEIDNKSEIIEYYFYN